MSTSYPAGFDTFPSPNASDPASNPSVSGTYKNLAASVLAIETELGQNPSGIYTDVTTRFANVGSTGPSSATPGYDFTLNGTHAAGISTITINETPPAFLNSRAVFLAIDVQSTKCEVVKVTSVSGSVFSLNSALLVGHSGSVKVLWLRDAVVNPFMFGGFADSGANDDWGSWQRAILAGQVNSQLCIDGLNSAAIQWYIGQPLFAGVLKTRNWQINSRAAFAPIVTATDCVDSTAMLKSARQVNPMSATSGSTHITPAQTPGVLGLVADSRIAFNNPYGETLPGGITSGATYWIRNVGSTYITIAATKGGTEITFSSDGTGWLWGNMSSLTHWFMNECRISINSNDLSGIICNLQQQSKLSGLYFANNGDATNQDGSASLVVGSLPSGEGAGQLANFWDVTFANFGTKALGLDVGGIGYHFNGYTSFNGPHRMVRITGTNHLFDGIHCEGHASKAIRFTGACRGIVIGTIYGNGTDPLIQDDSSAGASYSIGAIYEVGNNAQMIVDSTRGYTLKSWDGVTTAPRNGVTDEAHCLIGFSQRAGASYGPSFQRGLWRHRTSDSATLNCAFNHHTFLVDTTAGAMTVNLPAAGGMDGTPITFRRIGGSANATLTPASGQIDGGSTLVISSATPVRIVCYQGDWYSV